MPLLGAVALLIVGIARLALLLPPELGALRVIASVGVSAGMLWAIAPWTGILGVTFFGATAVVAVGAWRAAVIPGRLAAALVVALGGPTALFVATMVLPWYVMREAGAGALRLLRVGDAGLAARGPLPPARPSCRAASRREGRCRQSDGEFPVR